MVPVPAWNHDGDMNETLNDPGQQAGPAPQSAPPPPRSHQDLDRLRRSTSNRYIAGVAGGLGRHFNVDPTIIRVLLVVLTFFGGAGLLIYVACWLFVPEDTADHAPIRVSSEPRKILLLAAAGIAFLLAAGNAFSGFGSDHWWPVVSIAVVIAVVLIIRDRRHGPSTGTPPAAGPPAATPFAAAESPGYGAADTAPLATTTTAPAYSAGTEHTQVLAGDQPPTWEPPVARPPLLSPHPKRTGVIWFWPTLALIAVGLGILGIYDNSHVVVDGAYPALALGITAVMLLVGSVVGRPGGLILLGFLAAIALAGNVAVGGKFGFDAKEIHETPTTSAAVLGDYHATVGDIRLDLSQLSDPQALAGREIDVHLRTGSIEVILPRSLNANVDAKLDFAGGITVPGNEGGGFNHEVHRHLTGSTATNTAPLVLDLDAKLGQITVEYQ
jgi:phage shock protein PspC (stress-responsive transcriptional regulator)